MTRTRSETRAYHERYAEEYYIAFELLDSENVDDRQKSRNIFRYQVRGYCFELPPTCAHYGRQCTDCPHVKCRENEWYDGEKWNYDFDPDIDRFSLLFDNIKGMALNPHAEIITMNEPPLLDDTGQTLASLLCSLAERHEASVP